METDLHKEKRIANFIVWWIAVWYNLFTVAFFVTWFVSSYFISRGAPKADGSPSEEIGMFFGFLLALVSVFIIKIVHDKLLEAILNKLSK